jgi:pyruvate-formate lyase
MVSGYAGHGAAAIWDGAPTDLNIPEDFPFAELVAVLEDFAAGRGSNILTITCASPETLDDAPSKPERYDLLRVRMGGWSEFFSAMFPDSQQQHRRRPMAASDKESQA